MWRKMQTLTTRNLSVNFVFKPELNKQKQKNTKTHYHHHRNHHLTFHAIQPDY